LQHQDGVHLPSGPREPEAPLLVIDAFRREPHQLPEPVLNLTQGTFPHVHPDHTVDLALRRIAESGLSSLPVISRDDVREMLGTVSVEDIMAAYRTGKMEEAPRVVSGATIPTRLIARALAAVVAVALLGGFLNYFYRGERAARARRHFAEGNALAAAGRNEEAIEQYRDALSISHNADHRLALGITLLKVGRWNEAVIYLKEVSRERPDSAPVQAALGEAQFRMGEYAAARESFLRAVKIDPSDRASADRAELSERRLKEPSR
jgi:hypothetical protein